MNKYGGQLVYQIHDDDGTIEIIDDAGLRSLHFGSLPKQSSMSLHEPDKLVLEYVRSMTSWQLFKPDLGSNALLLGLGGGSISKFLLQQFPECRLKVIECRRSVVKIARSHFGLPLDPRIKILIGDGGLYVRKAKESECGYYDLIMLDAFDHEGVAPTICSEIFFQAAKSLLTKEGILVANLWGGAGNMQFQQLARWLGQCFNWNILLLPVPDRSNIIVLAFNARSPSFSLEQLRNRANQLEDQLQIEFPRFLKDLKKHNASTFNKLIST
jgi:spermidine synthase